MPEAPAATTTQTNGQAAPAQVAEAPKPAAAPEVPAEPKRAKDYAREARDKNAHAALRIAQRKQREREVTVAQERQRFEQERAEWTKRLQEKDAEIEKAKARPLHWSVEHGADPNKAIKDFVEDNAPERRIEDLEKQIAKDREERAEERRRHEEQSRKWQEQQAAQQVRASIGQFVKHVTELADKYPHLNSEFEPSEIAAQAHEVHQWAVSQEKKYSFDQIANWLEARAQKIYAAKADRRSKLLKQSPPDGAGATGTPGQSPAQQGQAAAKAATGNGRDSPPRPAKPRRPLTKEEEVEADLQALRRAFEKDARDRQTGKV